MKNTALPLGLAAIALLFNIVEIRHFKLVSRESPEPNDYLFLQRAFPYDQIPSGAYYEAVEWVQGQAESRNNSVQWELAGPTKVGGRITDVAMHASDMQTIYAATASGGVWKSVDAGENWLPITDGLPSLSIGDIAIDPSDKNTLYCGTGETNGGGGSVTYDGRGVFKSIDGGESWTSAGLENTGSIGRIEVDPKNPDRIFVAAMGSLFSNNPERGVYRSTDGGNSWEKTLFINDSTGVIDLAIHPSSPDTVFAVTWERIRRPHTRVYGGSGSGIWRSTDGGNNWVKLDGGLPQGSTNGRIGIAIAPSEPSTLYAIYAGTNGFYTGTYKSSDNGDTWAKLPPGGDPGYANFGWWFGQIRVEPNDPDAVFCLGIGFLKSANGGLTWSDAGAGLHVDFHALYIHPANPDFRVVGNDGGVYTSSDGGSTWVHRPFAVTQCYTSEIDYQHPERLYGGVQDNGTWRTLSGSPGDWETVGGGDGFVTLVNPTDDTLFYTSSQYGGLKGANGAVKPQSIRYNWNTPYIFDPNNADIMYFGAEKLFKSVDGGLNWTAISGDLSNGPGGQNGVVYGTVTTIAASPIAPNTLIAGTDDGNVWFTANGGQNWTNISDNLPKRWVTRVVADLWDANTIYVCLSGFRHFDDMAHVYRSSDGGQTWNNAAGNLPDMPVNDLILDPTDPNTWYIATDAGVMVTYNGSTNWEPLGMGLPNVPILDLTFHAPTRTLVAATFGRSMFRAVLPQPTGTHVPETFEKVSIAPNPFKDITSVSFALAEPQVIRLEIFDLSGRLVKTVNAGLLASGQQQIILDGSGWEPGTLLFRLQGKNGSISKKVIKTAE